MKTVKRIDLEELIKKINGKKMNEEALEKMKAEELRESIDEIEEEIGIEMFVNVVEEESVEKEEIAEKIERCERLRNEYVKRTAKLKRKDYDETSTYDKVEANLVEEIERLRNIEMKLKSEEKNTKEMEHAALKQEVNVKGKVRGAKDAATSAKKDETREVVRITKKNDGKNKK